MTLAKDSNGVRRTYWGPTLIPKNFEFWNARVLVNIDDEHVINHAKRLVDHCMPQKWSTFHGSHYYSFVTREFLLNLLLQRYEQTGAFPVGTVCIVDEWWWRNVPGSSMWSYVFNRKGGRDYPTAKWIDIPRLDDDPSLGVRL